MAMYKLFFLLALVFLLLGVMSYFFGAFLGRLPGDIVIQKENFTLYLPFGSMLLLSVVFSLLLNIWRW